MQVEVCFQKVEREELVSDCNEVLVDQIKRGFIKKLVVGKDGQIRVVQKKINKVETTRPVARVSFLNAAPFESKPFLVGPDPDLRSGGSNGLIARPTRKAAIAANNAIKSDIAANSI